MLISLGGSDGGNRPGGSDSPGAILITSGGSSEGIASSVNFDSRVSPGGSPGGRVRPARRKHGWISSI